MKRYIITNEFNSKQCFQQVEYFATASVEGLGRLADLWAVARAAALAGDDMNDVEVQRALARVEEALPTWASAEEVARVRRNAGFFVTDVLLPFANSMVTLRVVTAESLVQKAEDELRREFPDLAGVPAARIRALFGLTPAVTSGAGAEIAPVSPMPARAPARQPPGRYGDLEID